MFEDLNPEPPVVPNPPSVPPPAVDPRPAHPGPDQTEPDAAPAAQFGCISPAPDETAPDPELSDWKQSLRWDFEQWLAGIAEIPEPVEDEDQETPDLYSFYAQLAAGNVENRKANRRTVEALSQWGETLARFDTSLAPLRETISQLAATQPKEGQMSRAHCLALVDVLDRLQRIGKAFLSPPPQSRNWWGGRSDATWLKAWDAQRQAFAIVMSHLEELLRKEGVARFDTAGQRFDPLLMTAVAAEADAHHPPQTVLEELAAGYRRHGELLRPAQVKVSTSP